ncbi:MAG TPA: LuxR C-terminal-related transcriptional regulator [Microbacteriaceae bacterium]|nr:LuxR C-terminal-related transcriptional regulator [Microbacteriaceae bacterium]
MAQGPARVGMPRIGSGVVARPELSRRLDERARLKVVRGAAGCGKTSLVAEWLASSDIQGDVLWVSRAFGVASRAGYWESVVAELDRFGVQVAGGPLTEADARERVVTAFGSLQQPLLLVLDNFGPSGEYWPQNGRDLVYLLAAVPGLSAIVIGRDPLWLETPEAGAGVVIAGDELRLSAADARRIADAAGYTEVGDEVLATLLESAQGLVFPFRFAVEAAVHPGGSVAQDAIIARELHERGDGTAAIPYALSGRDFDLVAELLAVHFVEFDSGELDALADLVARIDPADLAANPGLALVTSLMRAPFATDPAEARAIFQVAIAAARSRRQRQVTARHRFGLAAGEAIAQRSVGRSAEAVEAARDALSAARDMSRGERSSMGTAFPMLLGQAGLSALYALEPSLARACFNAELAASPRVTLGRRRNVALSNLAMLAVLGGRMRRAERLLAEIVETDWVLERRDARPSAPYAIATAYLEFNRGDPASGARVLDAFGDDRPPASENWALTAVARAISLALSGEAREAESRLVAADAARRGPGERAGTAVAGVETTIELLRLVTGEPVIGPAREVRLNGRATVLLLVAHALRAALGGRSQTANELLGRATRFGTSPLQELGAALVAVIIARPAAADLRAPAERVAGIVVEHGLIWPLAILGPVDRAAVLDALAGSDSLDAVRAAFQRIPATLTLTPEVIEFYPRELAVLRDLAATSSRAELAARSAVSVNTIKTQLRSLYRKLGAGDRAAALARAAELGLLDRPGPS